MALKALVALAVVSLCGLARGELLVEVNFDLALQQESDTGYTASHTVGEYIKDSNLDSMRYLHTLASGLPITNIAMRTAWFRFKDYAAWAKFESNHLERSHVLYDLFWINWRKNVWESNDRAESLGLPARDMGGKTVGFIAIVRYSPKEGKSGDLLGALSAKRSVLRSALANNPGFLEHRTMSAGMWQSDYSEMDTFEFTDMESLQKSFYGKNGIEAEYLKAFKAHGERYYVSLMVPSAGSHSGEIFVGGAKQ